MTDLPMKLKQGCISGQLNVMVFNPESREVNRGCLWLPATGHMRLGAILLEHKEAGQPSAQLS